MATSVLKAQYPKGNVTVESTRNDIVIDTNASYTSGDALYLNVKGHATGDINNRVCFTFTPMVYKRNYTFAAGIGTEWGVSAVKYGFVAPYDSNKNGIILTISNGEYFHINLVCALN